MSKEVISHILHCHSTVYQMRSPISARGVWGPAVPAGSWKWCSPWQAPTMALYWARNINTTMRGLNCTNNIHGVGQTDWKRSKKWKPKQEFWNRNPKTDHGLCGHGKMTGSCATNFCTEQFEGPLWFKLYLPLPCSFAPSGGRVRWECLSPLPTSHSLGNSILLTYGQI